MKKSLIAGAGVAVLAMAAVPMIGVVLYPSLEISASVRPRARRFSR